MAKKNTYSYQAKPDEKIAKASGHSLKNFSKTFRGNL